jgi:SHS2 domain-containing protein
MKRFELVDISADAGIAAFGGNVRELFENAAAGMYSLITNVDSVQEEKTIDVAVERDSLEGLLVAWLNELIFRFDVDGFIAKRIVITGLSVSPEEAASGGEAEKPLAVRASLSGEEFDPARHEGKLLLKAATYHNLRIEKTGDIWRSEIIFDV